jgi:hypothetical protein
VALGGLEAENYHQYLAAKVRFGSKCEILTASRYLPLCPQKRRSGSRSATSGLAPLTDMLRVCRHVSKVPKAEVAASFDRLVGAGE